MMAAELCGPSGETWPFLLIEYRTEIVKQGPSKLSFVLLFIKQVPIATTTELVNRGGAVLFPVRYTFILSSTLASRPTT
jgi:hypothetical protein